MLYFSFGCTVSEEVLIIGWQSLFMRKHKQKKTDVAAEATNCLYCRCTGCRPSGITLNRPHQAYNSFDEVTGASQSKKSPAHVDWTRACTNTNRLEICRKICTGFPKGVE